MCPTRRGSAVVTAAVIAMLLTACTSDPGRPAPARPAGVATSSAAPAAESALACDSFIGNSAPVAPAKVVLGVVALQASPGAPALQTSLSGDGNGPLRLCAKTALLVRPGTTFELIVPGRLTSRLSIGWGAPGPP